MGLHEDIEVIVEPFSEENKKELRQLHKDNAKEVNIKHLSILFAKSKLSHDAKHCKRRKYLAHIEQAFVDLNEIELIEPILKIASCAESLNITFDFKRDSIEHMDPTMKKDVMGICYYARGDIYIGAKGLMDSDKNSYFMSLAVIAHEFCHLAMALVYGNRCKPYSVEDTESQQQLDNILQICQEKKCSEPFIDNIFIYSEHHQIAELIVRVPHLVVCYQNNKKKLESSEKNFHALFDFYYTKTFEDLKTEYSLLLARIEVKKLNKRLGYLKTLKKAAHKLMLENFDSLDFKSNDDKIHFISSNCPTLTMNTIYKRLKTEKNFKSDNIFMKIENLGDEEMLGLVEEAAESCVQPRIFIYCEDKSCTKAVEMLYEFGITNRLIFVFKHVKGFQNNSEASTAHKIDHFWSELSRESQESLMCTEVAFQKLDIQLGEIAKLD